MKRLDFGSYSSTEWEEIKRIHREMFWEELEEATLREAKRILQEQVYEEFEVQIGAKRFERTPGRRDERNGTRIRAYEITAGRIAELVIPRARKLDIRFTVFERWQRVQPKVLAALLKAHLLSRSASCAAEIAEAFGQSRFSRSFLRLIPYTLKSFFYRLNASISCGGFWCGPGRCYTDWFRIRYSATAMIPKSAAA